jgi:hypothetical protein
MSATFRPATLLGAALYEHFGAYRDRRALKHPKKLRTRSSAPCVQSSWPCATNATRGSVVFRVLSDDGSKLSVDILELLYICFQTSG